MGKRTREGKMKRGDPGWVEFQRKPDDFDPVDTWPEGHFRFGSNTPRCHAWSPRRGRQCLGIAQVSKGSDKCSKHGGASLSGYAHPSSTDLRYSKVIPSGMKDSYDAYMNDEKLLSLRAEIAVVTSFIENNISKLDSESVSPERWLDAKVQYDKMLEAMTLGKPEELNRAVFRLGGILNDGSDHIKTIENTLVMMESRKRLVTAESKQMVDASLMVSVAAVLALIDLLLQSVSRNVTDRNALQAIQNDFVKTTQLIDLT